MKFSKYFRGLLAFMFMAALRAPTLAQQRYDLSSWSEDVKAAQWETGAAFAGVTALGLTSWDWGSSKSFKFNPEGWFGKDTGSGGADKMGHAFASYALTNMLANRLVREGRSPERAALSAALTSQAIMLYVEVFDGLSNDHGFAREDIVMNLVGTGLAYARTVNSRVYDLLDFRMEYQQSGYKGYKPFSDYAGQKYLVALKLGGFKALRDTPFRYFELQGGYYTRGFSQGEQADGVARSRQGFIGVGINLNELFFGRSRESESTLINTGRLFLEHVQVPHIASRAPREF